jgi:hypothetical protein
LSVRLGAKGKSSQVGISLIPSMLKDWMTRLFTGKGMLHIVMLSLPFSMSTPTRSFFYRRLITRLRIARIKNEVIRD